MRNKTFSNLKKKKEKRKKIILYDI